MPLCRAAVAIMSTVAPCPMRRSSSGLIVRISTIENRPLYPVMVQSGQPFGS